jgi:hypothetical protein
MPASVRSVLAEAAGRRVTIDLWRELAKRRTDLPSYSTVRKRVKEVYGMSFARYISSLRIEQ